MHGTSLLDLPPPLHTAEDLKVVYQLDPLTDGRWDHFVKRHPKASIFHTPAWLRALWQTYGYKAVVYTTSAPGQELQNGMVFCHVESWLTGRRLVSLPFSDHCDALLDGEGNLEVFGTALTQETSRRRWRYVEVRPLQPLEIPTSLSRKMTTYHFHQLDLRPDLETIFRNFHRNSIQRKIRRAERELLRYEEGTTDALLHTFYRLFKMTRARHGLPPQPRSWFQNLVDCFGQDIKVRIAFKADRAIAGMITLRHNDTLVYKYGCSDDRFHNLGGMHLLLWRSIQEAKNSGLQHFDMGRTNGNQTGLVTFKNRWGAAHSALTYSRYAASGNATHVFDLTTSKWKKWTATHLLAYLQPRIASMVGHVLYKHVG